MAAAAATIGRVGRQLSTPEALYQCSRGRLLLAVTRPSAARDAANTRKDA